MSSKPFLGEDGHHDESPSYDMQVLPEVGHNDESETYDVQVHVHIVFDWGSGQFRASQKGRHGACDVTVWLASGDLESETMPLPNKKDSSGKLASGDFHAVLKLEVPKGDLWNLKLGVDFKRGERFLGSLLLGVEELLKGIEIKSPVAGHGATLHAHVQKPKDLNHIWEKENEMEFGRKSAIKVSPSEDWLGNLEKLLKKYKDWKGVWIFLLFFDPAKKISEDGIYNLKSMPWLAGRLDNLVAGPGIVYAFHMNIGALVYYCMVLLMFGFIVLPGCMQPDQCTVVVSSPFTFYIVFFVAAFLKFYSELAVLGCILPVKVLCSGKPSVPFENWLNLKGRQQIWAWLVMKVIGSLATSLDVFSSSVFLSRVIAQHTMTDHCSWTMEKAWEQSLKTSDSLVWNLLRQIFGRYPSFQFLAWALWSTVIMQCFFAVASSLPLTWELQPSKRKEQNVWYDFRPVHYGQKQADHIYIRRHMHMFDVCNTPKFEQEPEETHDFADFAEYHTLSIRNQVHGRALMALLKSSRMSLSQAMDTEYVTEAVKFWKPREIYEYQRQSGQFFIAFMMQRLLTTSLQATFLGISKNLGSGAGTDWVTLMNVILGCAMGVQTVCSEVSLSYKMMQAVRQATEGIQNTSGASKRQKFAVKLDRMWSCLQFLSTVLFAIFSLLCFVYCLSKAMMVSSCHCGLWNVGYSWPLNTSCVSFDHNTSCRMDDTNLSIDDVLSATNLSIDDVLSASGRSGSALCSAVMLDTDQSRYAVSVLCGFIVFIVALCKKMNWSR